MRDIVITSSVLIVVILGLRTLGKGRISPLLQYALWLPVVIRLLVPLPLWSSTFSILNYIPDYPASIQNGEVEGQRAGVSQEGYGSDAAASAGKDASGEKSAILPEGVTAYDGTQTMAELVDKTQTDSMTAGGTSASDKQTSVERTGDSRPFLRLLWIAGMLAVGGYMLFYQIKWEQYLRQNRKHLYSVGENGKYRGRLQVYTVKGLPSPCLCGNKIYLTKEMTADEKSLSHILAHEYCHYKHLDFIWVIVRCALCAVYWFHPLVWAAAYVSKQDSELACDAAAVRLLGEKERISYGKTLLQLIVSKDSPDKKRVGIASTMSGGEKGIRERIVLIVRKRKYMTMISVIIVILAAGFIAVTFSGKTKEMLAENVADGVKADSERILSDSGKMQDNLQNDVMSLESSAESDAAEAQQIAAQRQAALEEVQQNARKEAVLFLLSSYEKDITALGSQEGVYGFADAKNPADYVQAYYENGEEALEEGMYLLEVRKGSDGSDIRIYGLYSKEYGCEGVAILIADTSAGFDLPWTIQYGYGTISLYESAENGMPKTFAFQLCGQSAKDSEKYEYYLCDRDDTGEVTLNQFRSEDYLAQIKERVSFQISPKESLLYIYDRDTLVGSLDIPASPEAMQKIEEVVIDGKIVSWELGSGTKAPELLLAVGLKIDADPGVENIWYHNMPPLSFPVEYGTFGKREFTLGQAEIAEEYQIHTDAGSQIQSLDMFLEPQLQADPTPPFGSEDIPYDGHHDVQIVYSNPCPSYTRISDAFGSRINPVTQEVREHNGVDLAAEKGADILAAADGNVYKVGYDAELGNYVTLYHAANGEFSYYACCDEIFVKEGEEVTTGQKIAAVGSTGRSTGAHLHFAISRDGEYVEPQFE
ncbi:MAG: M23/M56 family metallopeptidase [Ruminococcus sp.]|nr:M23/M56 family metallopeptidase [Ruminococcus sp.]